MSNDNEVRVNPDLNLPVTVETTQGEIVELCKVLDMAVRARGNEAVGVVAFWLDKLQKAVNEAAQEALDSKQAEGGANGETIDEAKALPH